MKKQNVVKVKNKVIRFDLKDEYFVKGFHDKTGAFVTPRFDTINYHNGYFFVLNTKTQNIDFVKVLSNSYEQFYFEQIVSKDVFDEKTGKSKKHIFSKFYILDEPSENYYGNAYARSRVFRELYINNSKVEFENDEVLFVPAEKIFVDMNEMREDHFKKAQEYTDAKLNVGNDERRFFGYYNKVFNKYIKSSVTKNDLVNAEKMILKLLRISKTEKFRKIFNLYIEQNLQVENFAISYKKKIEKTEKDIKKLNSLMNSETGVETYVNLLKKLNKKQDALNSLKENEETEIENFKKSLSSLPTISILSKQNANTISYEK